MNIPIHGANHDFREITRIADEGKDHSQAATAFPHFRHARFPVRVNVRQHRQSTRQHPHVSAGNGHQGLRGRFEIAEQHFFPAGRFEVALHHAELVRRDVDSGGVGEE